MLCAIRYMMVFTICFALEDCYKGQAQLQHLSHCSKI
jgi:hypothetical protein